MCDFSLSVIVFSIVFSRSLINCDASESVNTNSQLRFLLQSLSEKIVSQSDDLKKDLDQNFRKLSSQLEANGRQVSKTLSIFENEWKDKTSRLVNLEERQDEIQSSFMKLTQAVHQLQGIHTQFEQKLNTLIQNQVGQTATPPPPKPPEKFGSDEAVDETFSTFSENPNFETYSKVIFSNPPGDTESSLDSKYPIQQDATIVLSGTPDNFKILEPIPVTDQTQVSSIELNYVTIDPKVLVSSLQNCSNLKSLKMFQVKLTNDWFNSSTTEPPRIVLPSLTDFVLDQVGVLAFRNDTIFSKWAEIDDFLKGIDKAYLKRVIFFDKDTTQQNWDIGKLPSLGINFEIRIDGIRIFALNHAEGEMNSMLKYTNDFLRNLDTSFILKKLAISAWRLDLALLPESITHLNMNYVLDINENTFNNKLQQLRNLQELNIFIGNQRDFGWSLTTIPTLQLKNLTIRYSDIRDFPTSTLLRLDHLYFHLCQIDLGFIQAFPQVFESLHIGVTFRKNSTSLHYPFLSTILTTPVEWIFMKNFDRRLGKPDNQSKRAEHFLIRAGVGKSVGNFILEKRNGTWQGRGLDPTELAWETLRLIGTDKFVTFDTYQKIFQS